MNLFVARLSVVYVTLKPERIPGTLPSSCHDNHRAVLLTGKCCKMFGACGAEEREGRKTGVIHKSTSSALVMNTSTASMSVLIEWLSHAETSLVQLTSDRVYCLLGPQTNKQVDRHMLSVCKVRNMYNMPQWEIIEGMQPDSQRNVH